MPRYGTIDDDYGAGGETGVSGDRVHPAGQQRAGSRQAEPRAALSVATPAYQLVVLQPMIERWT